MSNKPPARVLLTGATGFVGAHVLHALLDETSYDIVVVLRDRAKGDTVRAQVGGAQDEHLQRRISFVEIANLQKKGAFDDTLDDITYVVHVASPFAWKVQSNRKDLIEPAVEMTENVLQAVNAAPSVKRVVITGSFSSILNPLRGDVKRPGFTYTEADWNPLTNVLLASLYGPAAYLASKTLAEKAVWSFMKREKRHFDAVVLCPPMIYGPLRHRVTSAAQLNESSQQVYKLFGAADVPHDDTPFCDVRDVAHAHVAALTSPSASNQRYILCGGGVSWQAVCDGARQQYKDWAPALLPVGRTGQDRSDRLSTLDTGKARAELGMTFRTWKQSIVDDTLPQLHDLHTQWKQGTAA